MQLSWNIAGRQGHSIQLSWNIAGRQGHFIKAVSLHFLHAGTLQREKKIETVRRTVAMCLHECVVGWVDLKLL